ncbi:MAG TPA: hypothetical protein PLF26_19215 [Blastocatellia bacterium]|nr:hypothetical protein [Blastocatellia bacterium]
MENQGGEIWQVDVDGSMYEADTETITQWILDCYLTPATKVQKGSLKWIELGRVPAFRNMFATESSGQWQPAPAQEPPAYGQPIAQQQYSGSNVSEVCQNHYDTRARYLCQGCGASLCTQCVKRFGSSGGVCTMCGELVQPIVEARQKMNLSAARSSGFGLNDFFLAVQYPLKDPLGLAVTAVVYGILSLFGIYGRFIALAILFGYITNAIRRVAMGRYDDGPAPDLSDPSDLIFETGVLGLGIGIVVFGPLVAVILFGISAFDEFSYQALATTGIGVLIAFGWAVFYYPMALLVAGYTNDFWSVINPLVGLATMQKMGFTYLKAFIMCLVVYGIQFAILLLLQPIGPAFSIGGTIMEGIGYLVEKILAGAVWFFASMVMAAILGFAIFKKADALDLHTA